MSVLALDFDGTLVRSFTAEPLPGAQRAIAAIDSDVRVAIVTNQGGPALRITGGKTRYPTPQEVAVTLDAGLRAVGLTPQRVAHILIATWPGLTKGDSGALQRAAMTAASQMMEILQANRWQAYATGSPQWRKPAGGMLLGLASRLNAPIWEITYVGDMATDAAAARAAGVGFQYAKDWWR